MKQTMEIAIKLGNTGELRKLFYGYEGKVKTFELPVKLLQEKDLITGLIQKGFTFNVHGLGMYTKSRGREFAEKTCSFIQQSKDLGCNSFILHGIATIENIDYSEFQELYEETYEFLAPVVDYAKKLKVVCLLENGSYTKSTKLAFCEVNSNPFYHLKLSKDLGLGLVVDLGHAALSAKWFDTTLNELLVHYFESAIKPNIIHLSDNFLENDDHVAIGEGNADIDSFSQALTMWFDSVATIECFPDGIYRSLSWLCLHPHVKLEQNDIIHLCRTLGWKYNVPQKLDSMLR